MNRPQDKPRAERFVPSEQITGEALRRCIPMDSVRNLRDLGGYKTVEGNEVAWGKMYRSAGLHEASGEDIDFLTERLGISNIIDLRNITETEIEPEPSALVEKTNYHWVSILVEGTARDDIAARLLRDHPESQDFAALLVEVNHKLALDHVEDFKKWFRVLLNEEPPFLFHCTEGKDRTGFAAALFLAVMGVDKQEIVYDYLLTNTVNAPSIEGRIQAAMKMSRFQLSRESLMQLLMVHESYLEAAFAAIEAEYGSMYAYLHEAIALSDSDIQHLKNKFVKP